MRTGLIACLALDIHPSGGVTALLVVFTAFGWWLKSLFLFPEKKENISFSP
jgi:hypothetical protein